MRYRDLLEDVSTKPLPEAVIAAFQDLGEQQRGVPEQAMLRVQFAMGGGVLSPLVEHVGDITHRMSHLVRYGTVLGREKILKTYGWLTTRYGFEREMQENIRNNAHYRDQSVAEFRAKLNATLTAYAEAHGKLPVYNRAQWLARQATIDIGLQNWNSARQHLSELTKMAATEQSWTEHALEYRLDATGQPLRYRA